MAITYLIFNAKQVPIIINMYKENANKLYPNKLKQIYEYTVHSIKPNNLPKAPVKVSFLVSFTTKRVMTPATIGYWRLKKYARKIANELPSDNFKILNVSVLFKLRTPL